MTLDYGNYGIFLIMGNAGFISSTVWVSIRMGLYNRVPFEGTMGFYNRVP